MFGIFAAIGSWIVAGLRVAKDLVLTWLVPLVRWLYNSVLASGRFLGMLGRRVWDVLRATWDHVLKPAFLKIDQFIRDAHSWLEKHLGPALRKLNELRKRINEWWMKYVQPFLLFLDVARAGLRVLSALGVDWARKLDGKLGALQTWITHWIVELNRRLNQVADWINVIIDEGGLFQRIVLLKSIARDAADAWNVLVGAKSKAITADQSAALKLAVKGKKLPDVQADLALYLRTGGGDLTATVDGAATAWRGYLGVE